MQLTPSISPSIDNDLALIANAVYDLHKFSICVGRARKLASAYLTSHKSWKVVWKYPNFVDKQHIGFVARKGRESRNPEVFLTSYMGVP